MKIQTLLSIALLGLGGSGIAVAAGPQWPADAQEENNPQVLAFYQARCDQWAAESRLQGEQRDAYNANCINNAAQLWPVGWDESE